MTAKSKRHPLEASFHKRAIRIRLRHDGPVWRGDYRGHINMTAGQELSGARAESMLRDYPKDFEIVIDRMVHAGGYWDKAAR